MPGKRALLRSPCRALPFHYKTACHCWKSIVPDQVVHAGLLPSLPGYPLLFLFSVKLFWGGPCSLRDHPADSEWLHSRVPTSSTVTTKLQFHNTQVGFYGGPQPYLYLCKNQKIKMQPRSGTSSDSNAIHSLLFSK